MEGKEKSKNPSCQFNFHYPDPTIDLKQIREQNLAYEKRINEERKISDETLRSRFTI